LTRSAKPAANSVAARARLPPPSAGKSNFQPRPRFRSSPESPIMKFRSSLLDRCSRPFRAHRLHFGMPWNQTEPMTGRTKMFCDPCRGRATVFTLSGGIASLNPRLRIFEPSGFGRCAVRYPLKTARTPSGFGRCAVRYPLKTARTPSGFGLLAVFSG